MFDNKKGVVDGPFLKYSPVPDRKHDEGDKDEQDELVPLSIFFYKFHFKFICFTRSVGN